MRIDIVTIFPKMVEAALGEGIVGRAIGRGILDVTVHDLRDFATDRHRVVDDVPFGGGPGASAKAPKTLRRRAFLPSSVCACVRRTRRRREASSGSFVSCDSAFASSSAWS